MDNFMGLAVFSSGSQVKSSVSAKLMYFLFCECFCHGTKDIKAHNYSGIQFILQIHPTFVRGSCIYYHHHVYLPTVMWVADRSKVQNGQCILEIGPDLNTCVVPS